MKHPENPLLLPRHPVPRGATARGTERGFTLIELTVVVIIIGVFATMAIPQVTGQLRDRRIHEAAQRIALLYQQARLRAMGQGGAILVRYETAGSGHGRFTTKEGLIGGAQTNPCALAPVSNCAFVNWASGDTQNRTIESVDIGTEPGIGNVWAVLKADDPSAAGTNMDLCFTPLGRSYVRYGTTGPFTPLTGIPQYWVYRSDTGTTPTDSLIRTVLVLPTGIARLAL